MAEWERHAAIHAGDREESESDPLDDSDDEESVPQRGLALRLVLAGRRLELVERLPPAVELAACAPSWPAAPSGALGSFGCL